MSREFPMSIRTGIHYATALTDVRNGIFTVEEALANGRNSISEHGWQQGRLKDDEGRFCLVGGMVRSGGKNVPIAALSLISKVVGVPVEYLDDWNDAPGRTKEEVLAAYDKALVLARGGTLDEDTERKVEKADVEVD